MTSPPGADERRIRSLLDRRGVSYAPQPEPPTVGERPRERDWLDDILNARPEPAPAPAAAPRLPDWRRGQTADLTKLPATDETPQLADEPDDDEPEPEDWENEKPKPTAKPTPARRPNAAARRAQTVYEQVPARTRALLYTGAAAAAGYSLGLPQLFETWINACGNDTSTGGAVALGAGLVLASGVLIDRRTRAWWGPLPWLCRIPLASAILALLLYAPGATS